MKLLTIGLLASSLSAGCSMPNPVGPRFGDTLESTSYENPSPVSLTIRDRDKAGFATGTGPARFTRVDADGVQTLQTGTVPRDMFVQLPNGTRLNLSTGTDITADGLKFNPETGSFEVKRFTTSASEPLRAANEGLDRLVSIVAALTPAQRDAQLAYFEAQAKIAEGMTKAVLEAVIAGIKGGI